MEVIKVKMTKGQRAWAFTHQTFAELHAYIRTARFRLESATAMLHPLIRAPLLAGADTAYWTLMLMAGLAVLAAFCLVLSLLALVLLVPCTFVFIKVINYVPSDESSYEDNVVGTSIALSSVVLPFIMSGIASLVYLKYPQLEDMDFMAGFYDPLPLALQMVVSYGLLELGLVALVLLTFDFCVVMYWGGYGVSVVLQSCYQVLWQMPWYLLVAVAVPLPFLVLTLIRKSKHLFEVEEDEQSEEFWFGSEENDNQALQHEARLVNSPVPNSYHKWYENFWANNDTTSLEGHLLAGGRGAIHGHGHGHE
ncbi:hypothetical protein MPTK1_5g06490 [Marchantia polymorpha subsp. ruderalis]|uniref:Uncharacterized protein n=2 Tax=Marchantia polymorpha TaxID=3197 RepID=A0AAF6BFL0_MARPO|nr:hypothetical protein MARPO_0189s0005 [Marchantia polymorpha]BBN10794.1 hypothetical protein Mp_5g06490 [Marchantia polymorpha subsp. ruderalis]|eukprot:PTQ27630.1 hypothetical protein MARPO_0189s0005 [Marchantia polymorpha]